MTERSAAPARPAPEPDDRQHPSWDATAIAAALGTSAEDRTDIALGPGSGFPLRHGPIPTAYLEVFPAVAVRLTTPAVRLELARPDPPAIAPEQVVFSRADHATLTVRAMGESTLHLSSPPAAPDGAPSRLPPETRPDHRPTANAGPDGDPTTQDAASPASVPSPDAASADPERDRVRLAGRLGAAPRFRETRTGVLVASFPLAVQRDDGSVAWERVVVFRERAARLRGEHGPKQGELVEVVGYRHRREQPDRTGTTRVVDEVYAVVVKAR